MGMLGGSRDCSVVVYKYDHYTLYKYMELPKNKISIIILKSHLKFLIPLGLCTHALPLLHDKTT